MNPTSPLTESLDQDASARALLGDHHPLVRVSDRLGALLRQSLVAAALGLLSAVALADGLSPALAVFAADSVVGATLAITVAALLQRRRSHARTLIDQGRDDLPIAAVRRERNRLLDPRHRDALGRWLEAISGEARHPVARPRYARPLFTARVIRAVEPQLLATTTALRSESPAVRGVLRAQRMLERGASPLYGDDADALRRELQLIQLLLTR